MYFAAMWLVDNNQGDSDEPNALTRTRAVSSHLYGNVT